MNPKGHSLRWRDDKKRWVLSFPPPDGGRKWLERVAPKEIRREVDAKVWAAGLLSGRALTAPALPRQARGEGSTVRDLYPAWLAVASRRVEPATAAGYKTAFEAWVLPMLGDEPASALTVPRLREWVRSLCKQPAKRGGKKVGAAKDGRTISPMRVANTFSALSVFLSDMIADGKVRLPVNPALDLAVRRELPDRPKPGRVRIAGARAGVPTMEDGQGAFDASEDAFRVRLACGFAQGFRDGEVSGLRIRSLVFDAAVPHFLITEAVKLKGPKGHATPGKLKTVSSERMVPMHPTTRATILEWLSGGWRKLMHRDPQPNDFLLPGSRGGPARPKSAKLFREALRKAGRATERGGKSLTFHGARHAFATALAAAEVPKEQRDLLLGHSAKGAGEAHYTEHELATLAAAVAKVPLALSARPGVRPDARPPAEQNIDNTTDSLATPPCIEHGTFGLGNRTQRAGVRPSASTETASKATKRRRTNDRVSTNGLAEQGRPNTGRTLAALRAGLAVERLTWSAFDIVEGTS